MLHSQKAKKRMCLSKRGRRSRHRPTRSIVWIGLIGLIACGVALSTAESLLADPGPSDSPQKSLATQPTTNNAGHPSTNPSPAFQSGKNDTRVDRIGKTVDCGILRDAATVLEQPSEKAHAYLAVARCTLVNQCAPLLSSILNDEGDAKRRHDDAEALVGLTRAGLADLDQVSRLLAAMTDDAHEAPADTIQDRLEMLRAFAQMFQALGSGISAAELSADLRNKLIAACHGLAPYLDDVEPGIVAAAKFYQGHAYRLAGRADRTLQVMLPVLSEPVFLRIGFLARLERCRALADREQFAAGLVLCLRLETLAETWFDDEEPGIMKAAVTGSRAVRVRTLQQWALHLDNTDEKKQAEVMRRQARELLTAATSQPQPASLDLDESIPGLPIWSAKPTKMPDMPQPANDGLIKI